jgi:hypothetical protein
MLSIIAGILFLASRKQVKLLYKEKVISILIDLIETCIWLLYCRYIDSKGKQRDYPLADIKVYTKNWKRYS